MIGGGVMGTATARTLAERGRDIVLLERSATFPLERFLSTRAALSPSSSVVD